MKPLFPIVVAILVIATNAHPQNIAEVKELPQENEPVLEAEASEQKTRKERCTACDSQTDILAAIRNLPKAEVHTQQSFEGCSSDKGCAGLKVKDGKVIEKFGDLDAFNAAALADTKNEFKFHAAGSNVFEAGLPEGGPFWWMNQDSPFKGNGKFEKFSKTSSSSYSTSGAADLGSNPFLNGQLAGLGDLTAKFESKDIDITKNPFLNGAAFSSGSFNSASKYNTYTGSSPAPFTASGSNVNLIQNSQKAGFDYQQQQTQAIDEAFQTAGSSQTVESEGFQQTCSGQGYACVSRAQCINGVASGAVSSNSQKYCNVGSEVCCKIETKYQKTNFIETDSFTAGSESTGVYRPGTTGLKPGIPYLPPVDSSTGSSNVIKVTSPRPTLPPRPYLPPSTSAPGYLPPVDTITGAESRPDQPVYTDGGIILDSFQPPKTPNPVPRPVVPAPSEIPAGCAAALKCTPIEYCTAEGVISTSPVSLTRDQEAYRVPLTDCKDVESGRVGKCCRDPFYTDPWPTNQLGKWVPGVFGGNDGKYVPNNRGGPSTSRPQVPVTGSIIESGTIPSQPKYPNGAYVQKNGQGFVERGKIGVIGIGTQDQFAKGSQASISTSQIGQIGIQGQGQYTKTGSGQYTKTGSGQYTKTGSGQQEIVGQGQGIIQGGGIGVIQGQGQYTKTGSGQQEIIGQGQGISQGGGAIITQGGGATVIQGQGQYTKTGSGQYTTTGSGQFTKTGSGQYTKTGSGQYTKTGTGQQEIVGQGQGIIQGGGIGVIQGQGQYTKTGSGQQEIVRQGQGIIQGGGTITTQGGGATLIQGQGEYVQQGFGTGIRQGGGTITTQGGGATFVQGKGESVQQGYGTAIRQGGGSTLIQGQGETVSQGFGTSIRQGSGSAVVQGQGESVQQGFGTGIRQGGGYIVNQGGKYGVENEASGSEHRVFLTRYEGSGQCGILNPQKPYGNRQELEVDFAEIPWQAMVLLQTNRSLLCGGVITRPDVVITSASCVEGLDAKNVLIKGGEWKLGIDDEPLPFQIVQVKHILRHPLYQPGSLVNDAAVLVLTENLRLAKNIWPICLPTANETLDAFYNGAGECIVTGWGKQVLQSHLEGSIMHSVDVSLSNPGQCQSKLTQDYPHLLEHYSQDSCVCGQPKNPVNNICKVDIGSALACTTDDRHYVLRGIYSWDSGCQTGNQVATFYKFDLEWYEWSIGLIESVRFAQYSKVTTKVITQVKTTRYTVPVTTKVVTSGVKGYTQGQGQFGFGSGQKQITQGQGQIGFGQIQKQISQGQVTQGQTGFGQGQTGFGQGQTSFGQTQITKGQGQIGFGQGQTGYTQGQGQFGVSEIQKQITQGQGQIGFGQGQTQITQGQIGFGQGQTQFGGVKGVTGTREFQISGKGQAEITGIKDLKEFGIKGQGQTAQFTDLKGLQGQLGQFGTSQTGQVEGPLSNTFTATFTEKKYFQTEPKIVTYTTKPEIVTFTTKPEIVTFTTKPEYFTYTTKPKYITYTTKPEIITYTTKPEIITYTTKPEIVTYTTKPEIIRYTTKPQYIRYETSGTRTNPTYVAPESINPSFSEIVGAKHTHSAACKCLENSKK